MRNICSLLLSLCLSLSLSGQNAYFFPGKKFNPAIPSPEQFLGYPVGSHHTRHDKMVEYMRELDRLSDKVTVIRFGRTNEHREQILVQISDPANMAALESIRTAHLDLCNPAKPAPDMSGMPVIDWLGYNVHGNEPSGGEAAILTAYYLAASEEEETRTWLKNAVILMEPFINPDGRDRHSHWANSHKATPNVADPNDREHNEVWPGGRFNHYWFDLNRDWYLAQQVESQNRLTAYHQWLPNVVTDHHEMGTNANFFFEPSKQNAENPLVPPALYRDFNVRFGKYFEQALNEIGSLYGTQELFDNLYPGYGSSYPDMHGGLGLLFEQASSRGHVQESRHGLLTFAFTVRNQLVNALATVRASVAERQALLQYQREFFINAAATKADTKTWIVGDAQDAGRNRAFWEMLLRHQIEFYHLPAEYKEGSNLWRPGYAVAVPSNQPQNLLIRSIFEKQTTGFKDSLFYDASTWNLALAYGLKVSEVKGTYNRGGRVTTNDLSARTPLPQKNDYAYVAEWTDYYAPKALQQLHDRNILTKVASKAFSIKIDGKSRQFGHGTLIIPVKYQKMPPDTLHKYLSAISQNTGVAFESAPSGLSESGPDLGTVTAFTAVKPQVLMVVGPGVTPMEAGFIWHLTDTRVGLPLAKVDITNLKNISLTRYNTIIMPGGNYSALDTLFAKKLKAWVAEGNTLITIKGATEWTIKSKMFPKEKLREARPDTVRNRPRVDFEYAVNVEGARQTGGAIFEAVLDVTHPIGYGYTDRKIAVYRNNNTLLDRSQQAWNSVLVYTDKPLLSGYVHPQALQRTAGSAGINVVNEGQGRAILYTQDPNFRATWYGTNKLFLNAIYFAAGITAPNLRDGE